MARKKRQLPKKIELISAMKGYVREFELSHALRILKLQRDSGLGDFELYNTELYQYDGEGINFRERATTGEQLTESTGSED